MGQGGEERLAPFTPPNVREWRIDTTPTPPPPASTKKNNTNIFFFSGEPIRLQRPDNQSPNWFFVVVVVEFTKGSHALDSE
jgi:hypothetical protein